MRKISMLLLYLTFLSVIKLKAQHKPGTLAQQIPVMAWIGVPQAETTIARYREMNAAGITHSFSLFSNADAMEKALNIAQQTGIKLFISCPELKTDPEKTVRRFMKHPAIAGYYLRDEPSARAFPELGKWASRIKATDDLHPCYLNLLPTFAEIQQLGVPTYREYVSTFIKQVPIQMLSFDNYPIIGNSSQSIRELWYENLEIFSDEAKKANKPFWAFALTVAHSPYPVPTLAALRLQVYSDLAYGAQGIQFFTYWNLYDPGGYDFHNAPISLEGRRTEVYDKLKVISAEIKELSKVFLGAKQVSVAHTGAVIPIGTKRLSELPAPIKVLETEGLGAVVSVLKKGKESFLVVVNRDFVNPMKLNLKCEPEVKKVLRDGSSVPANTYMDTIIIDPGDIAIYQWTNKKQL